MGGNSASHGTTPKKDAKEVVGGPTHVASAWILAIPPTSIHRTARAAPDWGRKQKQRRQPMVPKKHWHSGGDRAPGKVIPGEGQHQSACLRHRHGTQLTICSRTPLQQELLDKLKAGYFDAVILSPPCATWSRAPWANSLGPRPLRSSAHPWGYPWLEGYKLHKVEASNRMVQVSLQVITICLSHNIYFILPPDNGFKPTLT